MIEWTSLSAPGYYSAFAYWVGAVLFILMNPRRMKRSGLAAVVAGFQVLLIIFTVLTDTGRPVFYLFVSCLLGALLLIFLMIFICCDISLLNAGYICLRAFTLGEFSASLEWQIYYFEMQLTGGRYSTVLNILTMIVIHGGVFAVMYVLERKYRDSNIRLRIRKKEFFQAFLIALSVFLISNISNIYQNTPFSSSFPSEIMWIRTLVDFGGVIMFYAYHMQLRDLGDRMEIEMLKQMMEAQYANYQVSEQSIALVHQKYHDLKHQIAFLKEETTSQKKLKYLDQMEDEIRTFEAQSDTGNNILDTILTAKRLQCMNQGINMTCVADGNCLKFIEPMDIMSLFGNALDNAIESTLQVKEQERRLIHVSVTQKKGFVVIEIGNSFEGELHFKRGLPQTTKGDERYHGYGTRSIQATAKRYGGNTTFQAKDRWFEVKVVIPFTEQDN